MAKCSRSSAEAQWVRFVTGAIASCAKIPGFEPPTRFVRRARWLRLGSFRRGLRATQPEYRLSKSHRVVRAGRSRGSAKWVKRGDSLRVRGDGVSGTFTRSIFPYTL